MYYLCHVFTTGWGRLNLRKWLPKVASEFTAAKFEPGIPDTLLTVLF